MSIKTQDIKEIKKGWFNIVLEEPLKRSRKKQYTIYNQGQRRLWRCKFKATNRTRH